MSGDVFLSDLVEATAQKNCEAKTKVSRTVKRFLREVQDCLARGQVISLTEFGRIEVVPMPAREGHDFATGARIPLAGRPTVRFTPFLRTERAIRSSRGRPALACRGK